MNDDLGPNKQRLFDVAATAPMDSVLVDLGVREGASSFTMLEATSGQKCRVIGVDPSPCPFEIPERYTYMQTDSVSAAAKIDGSLFMVFFDTLHIKEQVMAELHHYWPKIRVGGYAVFHDTEWGDKCDHYLGRDWLPPINGVNAFFGDTFGKYFDRHVERVHYPESWGMTFVKKLSDWNPVVPDIDASLEASRRLTKEVCGW